MSATEKRPVAAHVLRRLAVAKQRGRVVRLDELAQEIGVRRDDVRDVVTSLDTEGHVDARRLRLTMSGFAIAVAMRECKLRDARVRVSEPIALPRSA
jgi:DNA-binding IscR family transcriptional regulator